MKKTVSIISNCIAILASALISAAAADQEPAIAYGNSNARNHLAVYSNAQNIYGKVISDSGSVINPEFPISTATDIQSSPAAAFDSKNNKFLVVWEDMRNSNSPGGSQDIFGELVNLNTTLFSPSSTVNFSISTSGNMLSNPSIAYSETAEQYLVVWEEHNGNDLDITGALIDKNGNKIKSLIITDAAEDQTKPVAAYNSIDNQYLVIWEDKQNTVDLDIYWVLLTVDGNIIQPYISFTDVNNQGNPSVAYNSTGNRYLLLWEDQLTASDFNIMGIQVDSDGSLLTPGSIITVADSNAKQTGPAAAYDSNKDRYLAVWQDYATGPAILGKYISSAGIPDGTITFSNSSDPLQLPAVALNEYCRNFLVAYVDSRISFKKNAECSISIDGGFDGDGGIPRSGSNGGASAGGGGCFINSVNSVLR